MPVINDSEFGPITVRRSARASKVRIKLAPDGRLMASLPMYAPLFLVRRLLKTARPEVRQMLAKRQALPYQDGMTVGKSHTLVVRERPVRTLAASVQGQQIIVEMPVGASLQSPAHAQKLRDAITKALRREAKSYLPRRLKYLAVKHGYTYQSVRFSHASSRWGSCSSRGTISLNIALMQLPLELVDYVLLHELAHTKQLNHSDQFWQLVAQTDPDYATHRRELKRHTTAI